MGRRGRWNALLEFFQTCSSCVIYFFLRTLWGDKEKSAKAIVGPGQEWLGASLSGHPEKNQKHSKTLSIWNWDNHVWYERLFVFTNCGPWIISSRDDKSHEHRLQVCRMNDMQKSTDVPHHHSILRTCDHKSELSIYPCNFRGILSRVEMMLQIKYRANYLLTLSSWLALTTFENM